MFRSIGFIGTGHMGSIIAKAAKTGAADAAFFLSDLVREKAEALSEALGGECTEAEETAEKAGLLFIAVRPQDFRALSEKLGNVLKEKASRTVVVSMMAGVRLSAIRDALDYDGPLVRMMPNTPCEFGSGVIGYTPSSLSAEEASSFEALLSSAGIVRAVKEPLLDSICALSGSGPAFVYEFISAFHAAGIRVGLDEKDALDFALATIEGAVKIMKHTGKPAETLISEVATPGGTTIEGVQVLENSAFRAEVVESVAAAYEKAKKLSK